MLDMTMGYFVHDMKEMNVTQYLCICIVRIWDVDSIITRWLFLKKYQLHICIYIYTSLFHKCPLTLIPVVNGPTKVDSHVACERSKLKLDLVYIIQRNMCCFKRANALLSEGVSLGKNIPDWWPIHPVTRLPKLYVALCSSAHIVIEMEIRNIKPKYVVPCWNYGFQLTPPHD